MYRFLFKFEQSNPMGSNGDSWYHIQNVCVYMYIKKPSKEKLPNSLLLPLSYHVIYIFFLIKFGQQR